MEKNFLLFSPLAIIGKYGKFGDSAGTLLKLAYGVSGGAVMGCAVSLQLSSSASHRLPRGNPVSSLQRRTQHNCRTDLLVVHGCS